MKTTVLIASALICCSTQAQPKIIVAIPCNDTMIYQNPFVYGGQQPRVCAVTGVAQRAATYRKVLAYAKYGICDYEVLSRRATRDAWEKCGQPKRGIIRVSDWQFECLDHTYGSDLGATAEATFTCL